jgi:LysR family transcriptional regulator, hydrogen peroxide-inducible genes activator
MAIAAGVLSGLDLHVAPLEGDGAARRIAIVWRRSAGRQETFRQIAETLRSAMAPSAEIRPATRRFRARAAF